MKKYNVLIFPAGGENAINIFDSLKNNLHFNLFGASSVSDYAKILYNKNNYCLSNFYINDENFLFNFNELLNKFKIDYIIPTHDTIALHLMENENKINAKIVCSVLETARIANSKKLIYENVRGKDYSPVIYEKIEKVDKYPVFLKPDVGAGGKGTFLAKTKEELQQQIINNPNLIICENLPGKEITVDCFTNYKGELLFAGPRTRDRITMGISFDSSRIELTSEINNIANDLNTTFKFNGAWFFQLKQDINGKYKLMEFSVRQAGTMALYRQLGINFALLSLFNAMEIDVNILFNDYNILLTRRLKNAYILDYDYDNVYIDFDDTIIVNNMVNITAISYIYQCLNKGKKVFLLTKHIGNIYEKLEEYRIDKNLFEKIILIKENEKKSDYINLEKSILIDNYYIERKQVYDICSIPVFDVDAIECLLDYSDC